jgi:hypothetical protein
LSLVPVPGAALRSGTAALDPSLASLVLLWLLFRSPSRASHLRLFSNNEIAADDYWKHTPDTR